MSTEKPVIWQCPVCNALYSKQVSECYRCAETAKNALEKKP